MSNQRLDQKLLQKIGEKLDRPKPAINKMVSARAKKHRISSESALVIIASELGIGTAIFQRNLDAAKQDEIRDVIAQSAKSVPRLTPVNGKARKVKSNRNYSKSELKRAVESVIQDGQLRSRCIDILLGKKWSRFVGQFGGCIKVDSI